MNRPNAPPPRNGHDRRLRRPGFNDAPAATATRRRTGHARRRLDAPHRPRGRAGHRHLVVGRQRHAPSRRSRSRSAVATRSVARAALPLPARRRSSATRSWRRSDQSKVTFVSFLIDPTLEIRDLGALVLAIRLGLGFVALAGLKPGSTLLQPGQASDGQRRAVAGAETRVGSRWSSASRPSSAGYASGRRSTARRRSTSTSRSRASGCSPAWRTGCRFSARPCSA